MAIRIIKEGKKTKFTKTCSECGCEFEYELEDIKTDYNVCLTSYPAKYNTYVVCPCCGKHIHHGTTLADDWPRTPIGPQVYYTNTPTTLENNLYDCDKCPNKPDPNHPVVGDTPCTRCLKNVPTCSLTNLKGSK